MRPSLVVLLTWGLLAGPVAADCPPDTVAVYGGPGTLDGKFENDLGEPDPQGWTHTDDTIVPDPRWSVATVLASNLDPDVPDNHAWWCGGPFPACVEQDSAWGYGNGWDAALAWTGAVDPELPATVRVTGVLNADLEPGYDYLRIEFAKATGAEWTLMLDGRHLGLELDQIITYAPGEYVGEAGDSVRVRLRVTTDEGWSDEDCQWPTAGAVQVDNLQVTVQQGEGPPWSSPVETCEPGTLRQWRESPPLGFGDFAQVRTDVVEIDPDQDNPTPQWAFLDDGIVVPGVGPTYTWGSAYPPQTLAVNHSGGIGGSGVGPPEMANSVWSPPLALQDGWCGNLLLSFDSYIHCSPCVPTVVVCGLAASTDPTGEAGWEEIWGPYVFYDSEPEFHRVKIVFVQDTLPLGTRLVKIRLQARQLPIWCWGIYPTPAPTFDNVHLQIVPPAASGVPAASAFTVTAHPNPFNPMVTIAWELPEAQDLDVRIYDLSGRLVRTLRSGPAAAGPGSVRWRGRDDRGQPVSAGLYVGRVRTGAGTRYLKLTLLK